MCMLGAIRGVGGIPVWVCGCVCVWGRGGVYVFSWRYE